MRQRDVILQRQVILEEEISFRDLAAIFWRHRIVALVSVLVFVLFAVLYIVTAQPVYRAEVLLAAVPAPDESQAGLSSLSGRLGGVAALAGVTPATTSRKDEALAVLKSKRFTSRFIEQRDLLPVLFANKWDPEAEDWKVNDAAEIPVMADGLQLFEDEIRSIREDNSTELITLRIEWSDPELAAIWANQLVAELNSFLRERDIEEAQQSIEYLNRELEKTNVIEIRQGIYRLIERQIQTAMLANVRTQYAFKIIDPALVPETDKYAWPDKRMILVVAFALGIVFSMLYAAISYSWRK